MSAITPAGLHSIATLVKRLEASACRLEDIADTFDLKTGEYRRRSAAQPISSSTTSAILSSSPPPPPPPTTLQTVVTPPTELDTATLPPPPPPPPAAVVEDAELVVAYKQDVIEKKLKPFLEFTKGFAGPNVVEMAGLVEKEYYILLDFLKIAAACQKPHQDTLEILMKDFPKAIEAVNRAKEQMRRDREWYDHLTFLCDSAPVIAWVVNPKPPAYITSVAESMTYYGNKLKNGYKNKDPKHVEWVNLCVGVVDAMQLYTKKYHPTGASWNSKGITTEQYQAAPTVTIQIPSSGTPIPPPPPPPPPPISADRPTSAAAPAVGAAAVFAELNRGEDVTKGLRKVEKSEMTHKNPALRASSVVPASPSSVSGKKPIKPSKPQSLAGKKPPKFTLEGNKWIIENHEIETLTLDDVSINQSVNIFFCKGTTVVIKGKVNAVNMLNCQKSSVLVHSVVSSISITSSPSFAVQVTDCAPMIQVDKSDSGQIYLSKKSMATAEITTAKCSAINVNLQLEGEEEGVFEEQALPEMFKTVVVDGKLVTSIVEHAA